ncbi:hypothetical protein SYJ56_18640 [Algoriphagus sp. D3-2-R+10]|nr:hypothetical protein [Algoriphagus sp. D3-2-R+10]MEB2777339.1 hypothetical protein [Algoriphagus sp. D3-2-R+10]
MDRVLLYDCISVDVMLTLFIVIMNFTIEFYHQPQLMAVEIGYVSEELVRRGVSDAVDGICTHLTVCFGDLAKVFLRLE